MYYSDELVEEIREKNDIVSVVGEYVKLTRKGGSYFGLCPFHNEKTGSFSVSRKSRFTIVSAVIREAMYLAF